MKVTTDRGQLPTTAAMRGAPVITIHLAAKSGTNTHAAGELVTA